MSCRVESCEKPVDNCEGYIHHDEKQEQPKNIVLTKKESRYQMKIIRNGVCYIEREDIDFIGVLPQNICSVIQWDVYYSIKFKLLKLKDKESVQYFSDKDFILDYDMVKDLSTQELEKMRKEIENKLENLSLKWLNASINTREKLDKDKEYNFNVKSLKYYIESIKKYINNKELYDSEISTLSFNNFKKVELKRYSAVSRTEPVSRIPVSSSEIEKELYEVRVFNEDDRKNNESCKLEQHKALLYIDDVSEKYSNDMENNVYYECICLECGKHKDYKMSLSDRRHIIKTNLSPMETFMSFYEVRKRYLELIKQNCTVEEIIDNLNSFYKKNQEQEPVLIKKKN
mgnify:CR=1 FL=1